MDISTLIIVIVIGLIIFFLYRKKSHDKDAPKFDVWLLNKLQNNPSSSLEETFDEYIHSYDVLIRESLDEPKKVSEARTKLKLMDSYNLDEKFANDDNYEGYKMSLNTFVTFYDRLPPEGKEKYLDKFI